MNLRTFILVVIAMAPVVCADELQDGTLPGLPTGDPATEHADNICGPRCVSFLLNHFGRPTDVLQLVTEIQHGNPARGSSLSDLTSALKHHGLHCLPVQIPAGNSFRCCFPSIVHLEPHHDQSLGHFVIQMPAARTTASIRMWKGLSGFFEGPDDAFPEARSGAILVVADRPISIDSDLHIVNGTQTKKRLLVCSLLLGGGLMLILLFREPQRCQTAAAEPQMKNAASDGQPVRRHSQFPLPPATPQQSCDQRRT